MIEHQGSSVESIRVYYNVLESDEQGRPPPDPLYEPANKSPVQIIAKQGNKVQMGKYTYKAMLLRQSM